MSEPLGQELVRLREDLIMRVRDLRSRRRVRPPWQARFTEADEYRIGNRVLRRLRIILSSNGCTRSYCTMCPLPNESVSREKFSSSGDAAVAQVSHALRGPIQPEMICIYNDGSFFADAELRPAARLAICDLIRKSGAATLMVESLPEFIDAAAVTEVQERLSDRVSLSVGIGLQSADPVVREVCVASPVTEGAFLRAVDVLQARGVATKAYLMFKPPFLDETEAVRDVCDSAAWVNQLGEVAITLCPTRVAPGTVVHDLWQLGLYLPPALASVVTALRRLRTIGLQARVSLFNVSSSDFPSITPRVCDGCSTTVISVLEEYNRNPLTRRIEGVGCEPCVEGARSEGDKQYFRQSKERRVSEYLSRVKQRVSQVS